MKKLGLKAVDGAEKLFKEKRETRCGDPLIFDIADSFEAQSEPGQSLVLPGLHVFPKESVYLQFNLIVPETSAPGSAQFSIIQLQGKKPVGGCTYMIRIVKNDDKS